MDLTQHSGKRDCPRPIQLLTLVFYQYALISQVFLVVSIINRMIEAVSLVIRPVVAFLQLRPFEMWW